MVTPIELKVGDFFSYPGSFKIYQVHTAPTDCSQIPSRLRFVVSSNGYNKLLGIRLRADTQCELHDEFDVPILEQLACIAAKGHFENWDDGKFRFYFSSDAVESDADGESFFHSGEESSSIETVIRRSYEKYRRNLQRYRRDS